MPTDSGTRDPASPAYLVLALGAGVAVSLQSRVNGELALATGHGLWAALAAFAIGWVMLSVYAVASPDLRRGVARASSGLRSRRLPWWSGLGGVFGAFIVVVQSSSVPIIGVALFTIALVSGQTGNALVADRLGLSPSGVQQISPRRAFAGALGLVGVVIAVSGRDDGGPLDGIAIAWVAASVMSGGLAALQHPANARVAAHAGSPVVATWVNFTMGFLSVGLLALVLRATGRLPDPGLALGPWWAWTGSLLGIVVVLAIAVATGRLGVLVTALLLLTGQLGTALALDIWAPTNGAVVTPLMVAGVLVTFAAAALATRVSRARLPREGLAG